MKKTYFYAGIKIIEFYNEFSVYLGPPGLKHFMRLSQTHHFFNIKTNQWIHRSTPLWVK